MNWFRRLVNKRRLDADLQRELEYHLERQTADNLSRGMPEAEARRQAKIRFGGVEQIQNECRESRGTSWLEAILQDVRLTFRGLIRTPQFTMIAVLTLALGIGATTAIFTLVQQVMLQSLAVSKPEQLWRVGDQVRCCQKHGYSQDSENESNDWNLFPWNTYSLFRANTGGFEHLAALQAGNTVLTMRQAGSTAPLVTANGQYVSGNFFETFGVSPWRGRLFIDADDQEAAPPVAILSFHAWQGKYGADPSVVGSTYQINGHAFTVVGVAPAAFVGAKIAPWGMPDVWIPLSAEPLLSGSSSVLKNPRVGWLDLVGRVKDGTNPKTLQAQLQNELHGWLASHVTDMNSQESAVWEQQTLKLSPGGAGFSSLRRDYSENLLLLMAVSCCVLLVGCANVANLQLARGLRARQQTAVRVALGASRMRLVRSALFDSVLLASLGGLAAIAVAWGGARLILYLAFHTLERSTWIPVHASPSPQVLLFALGVSLLTGVLFGIAPAWIGSHANPVEAMRGANRQVGGNRHWAQTTLVIGQAAISLVLLSAAGMLGGSLRNLKHQDFGFNPDGRYLLTLNSPLLSSFHQEQLPSLFLQIQERLSKIPGVHGVSAATYAPLFGSQLGNDILISGRPEPGPKADISADWTRITPRFFTTLGVGITHGRSIEEDDRASTQRVAVVNEAFAKKFFGGHDPTGQRFGPTPAKNAGTYEIVGVVQNIHYVPWDFKEPARAMYYIPEAQTASFEQSDLHSDELLSQSLSNIVVWAQNDPSELSQQVRKALEEVSPDLVLEQIQPYRAIVQDTFDQQNTIASLTWLFGAVGLLLAAIGLYGVTSYGVEQRKGEIGVRMALGADRGSVLGMILRGAFSQVGIGLAIGIPCAVVVGYLMASQLFGVRPWNPLLLATATALLALAAFVAAVIPARRAASVAPMQALRSD